MRRIVLVPLVLTLSACGGTSAEVEGSRVEATIEQSAAEKGVTADVTVDCAETLTATPNTTSRCSLRDSTGFSAKVLVHWQNDEGEFAWEIAR